MTLPACSEIFSLSSDRSCSCSLSNWLLFQSPLVTNHLLGFLGHMPNGNVIVLPGTMQLMRFTCLVFFLGLILIHKFPGAIIAISHRRY